MVRPEVPTTTRGASETPAHLVTCLFPPRGTPGDLPLPPVPWRGGGERPACNPSSHNCLVGRVPPGRGLAVTVPARPRGPSAAERVPGRPGSRLAGGRLPTEPRAARGKGPWRPQGARLTAGALEVFVERGNDFGVFLTSEPTPEAVTQRETTLEVSPSVPGS